MMLDDIVGMKNMPSTGSPGHLPKMKYVGNISFEEEEEGVRHVAHRYGHYRG